MSTFSEGNVTRGICTLNLLVCCLLLLLLLLLFGRTKSQTLKSSSKQVCRSSSQCSERHNSAGAGHVVRMPDERLPKRILYGELLTGARSHGGQKKRFKDTLKASLKDFGIDHNSWETTAQNRAAWR